MLPDVFETATCSGFRRRVLAAAASAVPDEQQQQGRRVWRLPPECPELVEPIAAPRIRSMLAGALSVGLSILPADWAERGNPVPFSAVVERQAATGGTERLHRPFVQVVDTSWLIDNSPEAGAWHRDRWVEAEDQGGELSGHGVHGAVTRNSYTPPEVVHLAMYFEDVTPDRAPVSENQSAAIV